MTTLMTIQLSDWGADSPHIPTDLLPPKPQPMLQNTTTTATRTPHTRRHKAVPLSARPKYSPQHPIVRTPPLNCSCWEKELSCTSVWNVGSSWLHASELDKSCDIFSFHELKSTAKQNIIVDEMISTPILCQRWRLRMKRMPDQKGIRTYC